MPMLYEGANFLFLALLFFTACAAIVYALYCVFRGTGKRLRLLGHVKSPWMIPLFMLVPYSGFLTEEGRSHRAAARNWLFRGAAVAGLSAVVFLVWALILPRPPAWCATATAEHPKAGCPIANR